MNDSEELYEVRGCEKRGTSRLAYQTKKKAALRHYCSLGNCGTTEVYSLGEIESWFVAGMQESGSTGLI